MYAAWLYSQPYLLCGLQGCSQRLKLLLPLLGDCPVLCCRCSCVLQLLLRLSQLLVLLVYACCQLLHLLLQLSLLQGADTTPVPKTVT